LTRESRFNHWIRRHREAARSAAPAHGYPETVRAMTVHIERYLGPISTVFHEQTSEAVHVDVHHVGPSPGRNYHTLVTSGMSDRPMRVLRGDEATQYAELVMSLSPAWPLDRDSWPVQLLRFLARSPHLHRTAFWVGDTIPNGDPPRPYAADTGFCGALLSYPLSTPSDFWQLEIEGRQVWMLAVVPIYGEEMAFKLQHGAEALMKLLAMQGDVDLVGAGRPSALAASGS
jgi:hypothetical protein